MASRTRLSLRLFLRGVQRSTRNLHAREESDTLTLTESDGAFSLRTCLSLSVQVDLAKECYDSSLGLGHYNIPEGH